MFNVSSAHGQGILRSCIAYILPLGGVLKLIKALVKVTAGLHSGKTLSALAEAYL